jgi:nucleoid-associated protein YgaU
MQRERIQIQNLHLQDGKLVLRASAPSLEAANKAWDEIKRVNPQMTDISADIPVNASTRQNTQTASTYKVKPGDTLSKISKQFYGSPNQYMKIFEANKDKLTDPDNIQPGQDLRIPAA